LRAEPSFTEEIEKRKKPERWVIKSGPAERHGKEKKDHIEEQHRRIAAAPPEKQSDPYRDKKDPHDEDSPGSDSKVKLIRLRIGDEMTPH